MVRPNRIKEYSFNLGSLTSTAAGNVSAYSDHPINGVIQKVVFNYVDYTNTGSLWIFASGLVTDQILYKKGVGADIVAYPMVYAVDNDNATGSPQAFVQPVINAPLWVVASGVGDSKTVSGLSIQYI
jgi:hypothetical protein